MSNARRDEEDAAFQDEALILISRRDGVNLTENDSIAVVGISVSPSNDDRLMPKKIFFATVLRGVREWDSAEARTAVKDTALAALCAHSCSMLHIVCTNACKGDDTHGPHCNATGLITACPDPKLWAHVEVMLIGPNLWATQKTLDSADRLWGMLQDVASGMTDDKAQAIEELSRAMGRSILGGGRSPHEE